MRFSFFFFAEYAAMFVVSGIQTSLWLGAWYDPFGIVHHLEKMSHSSATGGVETITHWKLAILANVLGVGIFVGKSYLLVFVQIWLRWTLPRLRIDQVLYVCVKVLLPLSCFNLLAAAVYLWLTEPLLNFQRVVQIILAGFGVLLMLALMGVIGYAWVRRERSTFKVIFESSRAMPTLPGA